MKFKLKKESGVRETLKTIGKGLTAGNRILPGMVSTGLISYLLGSYLGPHLLEWSGLLPGLGGPNYITPEQKARISNRMGLLGAGLSTLAWSPLAYKAIKEKGFSGLVEPWSKQSSTKKKEPKVKLKKEATLIPIFSSKKIVDKDPYMNNNQKLKVNNILDQASLHAGLGTGSKVRGLLNTDDLFKGLVGSGLGYAAAKPASLLLGSLFDLPISTQRKMSRTGVLLGALQGAGIIS